MKYIVKTISRCDSNEYYFDHPKYKECKNLKELLEYLYKETKEAIIKLQFKDIIEDIYIKEVIDIISSVNNFDENNKVYDDIEMCLRIIYKYQLTKKQINKIDYNYKIENIKNVNLKNVLENEDLHQVKELFLIFLRCDDVCEGEEVQTYYIKVKEVEDDVKLCLFHNLN